MSLESSSRRPDLISHAGDASNGDGPGTLAAYQLAWDRGFRFFQIDVVALADGSLLSSHAVTGRKRGWEGKSLAELRAGGESVDTVEEIVTALPDSQWNLEIKSVFCLDALAAFLREEIVRLDRILISSPFRPSILLELRREFGSELRLAAALIDGGLVGYRLWPRARYADVVQLWFPFARFSRITSACTAAGHEVHVWSLNTREQLERHVSDGSAGLITDEHELALEILAKAGVAQ